MSCYNYFKYLKVADKTDGGSTLVLQEWSSDDKKYVNVAFGKFMLQIEVLYAEVSWK